MSKTTFKGIPKLIERAINEATSYRNMLRIAKSYRNTLRKRTRLGRRVASDLGKAEKLKPLSDGYVEIRRKARKSKAFKLSPKTRPKKSNLTQTGDMLNDLALDVRPGRFKLRFNSKKSKKKAQWVSDQGREFMHMSKAERTKIIRELNVIITKIVNKL